MFYKCYSFLAGILSIFFPTILENYNHPLSWKNGNIIRKLRDSDIISIHSMKDVLQAHGKTISFDNNVFLIELEHGLKAVFKPADLFEDDCADAEAEVAAYNACVFLGFPYIPPTIMRTINNQYGSLQLYVDTPIDILKDHNFTLHNYVSLQHEEEYKLFCFVFGQWDTGTHNMLMYHDGTIYYAIAIDNAGIKNKQYVRYGELPFVRIWYDEKLQDITPQTGTHTFPFNNPQKLTQLSATDIYNYFQGCIPLSLCKGLARKKTITYIIYNHGLWIQHHADDESFEKSFVASCSKETLDKLKQLDLNIIHSFFSHARSDCFNESFFNAILQRRDQVIAFFSQQAS